VILLMAATTGGMAVAASSASATPLSKHHHDHYGPQTCTVNVSVSPSHVGHGGTITVALSGDCFDDSFSVVVHTKEKTIGTITTNHLGSGSGTFALPCGVNVGTHTVTAIDAIGNLGSAPLTVTPAPCASAPGHAKDGKPPHNGKPPHSSKPGKPKGSSHVTVLGVNASAGIPAGAAVVGTLGLVILRNRKRPRRHFKA
jgi:hypothetical protein